MPPLGCAKRPGKNNSGWWGFPWGRHMMYSVDQPIEQGGGDRCPKWPLQAEDARVRGAGREGEPHLDYGWYHR